MAKRILIIGAGFAATDAALSAARLRALQKVSSDELEITVIAPDPVLTVRPRLYEPNPDKMKVPLLDLFSAVDVNFVSGTVTGIDTDDQSITFANRGNEAQKLRYDRLVLAAGSSLFRPPVPGVDQHTFSVDSIPEAVSLDLHLNGLTKRPDSPKRNTIVVAGGGFTGIEVATEMAARLRNILGPGGDVQVIIVDRSSNIAPDMGDEARPHITQALRQLGIRAITATAITGVDADGVTLSNGERIDASTVIWAAGMRATPLTACINAERDNFGRLLVDAYLAVPGVANVWATGDAAKAASDDLGNHTLMSCQHAKRMGAYAGNNAAASLLNVDPEPYQQRTYVTCLDLGEPGALFTRGWDRKVEATGADAKAIKQEVNTIWIYPPKADRATALAYAKPSSVVDL